MLDSIEPVERSDLRQPRQLFFPQRRHTQGEIFGGAEMAILPA